MAQISQAAGLSIGLIYNYFPAKEAIIEAIVERDLRLMFSIMDHITQQPGPRLESFIDNAHHGVDINLQADFSALQLEMLAEAARNPKVAHLLREADALARNHLRTLLVGQGITQRQGAELDGTIEAMGALYGGLCIRAVLNPALDREHLVAAIRRAVRGMLQPLA